MVNGCKTRHMGKAPNNMHLKTHIMKGNGYLTSKTEMGSRYSVTGPNMSVNRWMD